jgi:hypothetical protein
MILSGKQSLSRRHRERGSVLVFCMVLAALGTIGLAAWLSLLSARGHQVESNFTALKRRAVQNNSKALAYHAIYRNHLHASTGLNAAKTYTLPDSLGRAAIRAYAPVPLNQTAAQRMSKIGSTPMRSYSSDVIVDIGNGAATVPWTFQMRSENPVMGGELLDFHPPADFDSSSPIVTGNLTVKGRAVFWDAAYKDFNGGIKADEFLLPNNTIQGTTFQTSAGAATLPLNYPIPRQTTGFAGGNPSYLGALDIVSSTANSHNSHADRIRATGAYFEVSGMLAAAKGRGADTRPPGSNDSLHVALITASAASPQDPDIKTKLSTASPLSSNVLIFAVDHPAAFPANDLFEVLNINTPLPNDVISRIAASTVTLPSPPDKKTLFKNSSAWVTSDGTGGVTVALDEADLQHLIITDVKVLVLNGPSTTNQVNALAAQPARAIAIINTAVTGVSTILDEVRLVNQNRRRLSLAISLRGFPTASDYIPDFTFSGVFPFPAWTMVMDLENTGGRFDVNAVSSARLIGGIRANRSLSVVGGELLLERETVVDSYNNLLSRNAWIEAYRN